MNQEAGKGRRKRKLRKQISPQEPAGQASSDCEIIGKLGPDVRRLDRRDRDVKVNKGGRFSRGAGGDWKFRRTSSKKPLKQKEIPSLTAPSNEANASTGSAKADVMEEITNEEAEAASSSSVRKSNLQNAGDDQELHFPYYLPVGQGLPDVECPLGKPHDRENLISQNSVKNRIFTRIN